MKSEKSSLFSASVSVTAGATARKSTLGTTTKSRLSSTTNVPQTPSSTITKKPVVNQPVLQISSLQATLKEKETYINQLIKERDLERSEFSRRAQTFEDTEAKNDELKKSLKDKNEEITLLKSQLQQFQTNIQNLNESIHENKQTIEELEFQLEEYKFGLNKEEDNKSQEKNNESKQSSTSVLHQSESFINEATENLLKQLRLEQEVSKNRSEEINFLKEQNEKLKFELEEKLSLDAQLEQAQKDVQDFVSLKEKITQLEAQIKTDENEKSNLQTKLTDIEFLYNELQIKQSDQEKQIEATLGTSYKETIDSLEFQLEEQKISAQELTNKIKTIEDENKRLENQVKETQETKDNIAKQLEDLKKDSSAKEAIDRFEK